jgi:hypothetical protein
LNQLAYQYGITLIDTGSLIRVSDRGVDAAFADVRIARVGVPCLLCAGAIDSAEATAELRGEQDRQLFLERHYLEGGSGEPAASVLPLNSITVGLAALRLLNLVAPWNSWDNRVTFELRELRIVERSGTANPDCGVCGRMAPIGRGDDVTLRCRPSAR